VPNEKEPRWNAFEKVHISLIPIEVLAAQRAPQAATGSARTQVTLPAAEQPALKTGTAATDVTESVNDLRLQLRELTNANLDLRARLKEQSGTIEKLKAEHELLRNEIKAENSMPPSARKPSHK
jgi:peptidoglycan hydrolase CwlO-like protein